MAKKAKTKPKIWTYAMEEMSYPDVQVILKTTDGDPFLASKEKGEKIFERA